MTESSAKIFKAAEDSSSDSLSEPTQTRYRVIPKKWQFAMTVMTASSVLLAINQIFNLGFFVGYVMLDSRYMYLITGVMLSLIHI